MFLTAISELSHVSPQLVYQKNWWFFLVFSTWLPCELIVSSCSCSCLTASCSALIASCPIFSIPFSFTFAEASSFFFLRSSFNCFRRSSKSCSFTIASIYLCIQILLWRNLCIKWPSYLIAPIIAYYIIALKNVPEISFQNQFKQTFLRAFCAILMKRCPAFQKWFSHLLLKDCSNLIVFPSWRFAKFIFRSV